MLDHTYTHDEVGKEHERWVSMIGQVEPYHGRNKIGIHEVLHAHFLLIDFFFKIGEGIGGIARKI